MSEEMKEMEKQMKAARIREKTMHEENKTVNKDFSPIAVNNTEKRTAPEPTAVPNVGVNPRKNKKQSKNIPFY
jgi:hypothetical protein